MTTLEEYKLSIDVIVKELREGRNDIGFCKRVADKLEEMMQIVINASIANEAMTNNLQIVMNANKSYKKCEECRYYGFDYGLGSYCRLAHDDVYSDKCACDDFKLN